MIDNKKNIQVVTPESIIETEEFNQVSKYLVNEKVYTRNYCIEMTKKNAKYIEYKQTTPGLSATYNYLEKKVIINPNISNLLRKNALSHELLHIITDRNEESKGFKRPNPQYGNIVNRGISIDEAITEEITQKITGKEDKKAYGINRDVYNVLKYYIKEQYFLSDYYIGTNSVEREIKRKYGNEGVKCYESIIDYLDAYTIADNEKGNLYSNNPNYEKKLNGIKNVFHLAKEKIPQLLEIFNEIYKEKYSEKER